MNKIEEGTLTLNAFTAPWFRVTIYQILRPLFSILDTTILSELQNCANKYHFFLYGFVKFNLVQFSPKPHSVQR